MRNHDDRFPLVPTGSGTSANGDRCPTDLTPPLNGGGIGNQSDGGQRLSHGEAESGTSR